MPSRPGYSTPLPLRIKMIIWRLGGDCDMLDSSGELERRTQLEFLFYFYVRYTPLVPYRPAACDYAMRNRFHVF